MKPSKISIVIADDHGIFREGLRALLEKEKDMEVTAEAENGRQAVELARKLSPDVVIMDISMPLLNGIDAARQIAAHKNPAKIVMLSMFSYKRFLSDAFSAGAAGYLLKDGAFDEVVRAIHDVLDGKVYVSPQVAGTIIKDYVIPAELPKAPALSAREREVLQLIAEGNSTKKIAADLRVSVKTVDVHRSNIMRKLDIHDIPGLTKYAIREGIASLDK